MLKAKRDAEMKTRFKMWWRLVGSAIEHAAKQSVDFGELFRNQDATDEDDTSLAEVLAAIEKWAAKVESAKRKEGFKTFLAAELAPRISESSTTISGYPSGSSFFPTFVGHQKVTAINVGIKAQGPTR